MGPLDFLKWLREKITGTKSEKSLEETLKELELDSDEDDEDEDEDDDEDDDFIMGSDDEGDKIPATEQQEDVEEESDLVRFYNLFPNPKMAGVLMNIVEDSRINLVNSNIYDVEADQNRGINYCINKRPSFNGMSKVDLLVEAVLQECIAGKTREPIPEEVDGVKIKELVKGMRDNVYENVVGPTIAAIEEKRKTYPNPDYADKGELERTSEPFVQNSALAVEALYDIIEKNISREETMEFKDLRLPLLGYGNHKQGLVKRTAKLDAEKSKKEGGKGKGDGEGKDSSDSGKRRKDRPKEYHYEEWSEECRDCVPNHTTVIEDDLKYRPNNFVEHTLEKHSGVLGHLREYFAIFRPVSPTFERKQPEGDELDFDALMDEYIDRQRGCSTDDNVYIRQDKSERDVATFFLVDLSGSTAGQRIRLEKEALTLMTYALQDTADKYAIGGFSGEGRHNVAFYMVKDFDEEHTKDVDYKIGGLESMEQNRDGAALRHAITLLNESGSKTKLLILLSDGEPGDSGYDNGNKDTRKALEKAKNEGIIPVCITVDNRVESYKDEIYGDSIPYIIVDDVEKLPQELPKIYRNLTENF